jgi:hypothetical protein
VRTNVLKACQYGRQSFGAGPQEKEKVSTVAVATVLRFEVLIEIIIATDVS